MSEPRRQKTGHGSVALLLAAALLPAAVRGAEGGPLAEIEVLGQAPGRGEQCLVCRRPIHGAPVLEVRYRGRVFHVKADMMDELEADPEAHFRRLQSRAALFDEVALERSIGTGERGRGWLYLGLYVLVGLSFGAVAGAVAVARGHRPLPWFLGGLVLNLVALAVLLCRGRGVSSGPEGIPRGLVKVPSTRSPRPCPHCEAPVHPAARACSACGGELRPAVEPESGRLAGGGGSS